MVVDTNVVVSALLKPDSVPARALELLLERAELLLDPRLAAEYARVLERPKFASVDPERRRALLARIAAAGRSVDPVPAWEGSMPDPDDRPFLEVALAGGADALVTGNTRDYPAEAGVELLAPAGVAARLAGERVRPGEAR